MLLIIEALLLISAALVKDHRAAAEPFPLDMQEDSVDDDFKDCENEMLGNLHWLEQNVKNKDPRFMEAWGNAAGSTQQAAGSKKQAEECKKKASGSKQQAAESKQNASGSKQKKSGRKLRRIRSKKKASGSEQKKSGSDFENESKAIRIWTDKNTNIYGDFNEAVRTGKQKYQDKTYEWYKLHFYLTRAIRKLKNIQTECVTTYRRTHSTFEKENVINTEIRFGSFASSSFDKDIISGFGNKSCFEIYTCFGAHLTEYSQHPKMCEVLIPPYETFTVKKIKEKKNENNLWCDTVYVLESFRERSDLSCAIANKINSE